MKVDVTRATQAGYVGLSMKTRVAFGTNAAEPDYRATNSSNRRVFTNSTLVIQSGGQYDGIDSAIFHYLLGVLSFNLALSNKV